MNEDLKEAMRRVFEELDSLTPEQYLIELEKSYETSIGRAIAYALEEKE